MSAVARRFRVAVVGVGIALGLGGCVTVPTGPVVMVLPGQYKPFDQFRADDVECRQYAAVAIGAASDAAVNAATAQAVGGTLLGAAVGAAIGAATGQAGQGAAIGAGTGLLFGGTGGANVAGASSYQLQQRYDGAYMQCMYGKGNQIPVRGGMDPGYGNRQGPAYGPPPGAMQSLPPPRSQ